MPRSLTIMECFKLFSMILLILTTAIFEINSEEIAKRNEESVKPPLVVNPIDHLTLNEGNVLKPEHSRARDKRQSDNKQSNNNKSDDLDKPKPPPDFNPLESLILNQDKNGFKPEASLSRVKRQYSGSASDSIESEEDISHISYNSIEDNDDYYEGRYPYPYPIPIFIGGGFGGFGGRGFGGRGFGGGFGGRGFGGRGFGGGFGGRGFGGGFGGRGGGFGGGRGGGGGRG